MSDLGKIWVPAVGPEDAAVLIVGQSPGADEEEDGEPFVGPAGELLQEVIEEAGLEWRQLRRTNVFKYRLWTKDQATITGLIDRKWRAPLIEEIEALPSLRVIVTLGNEALYALSGKWGITLFRGHPTMAQVGRVARRMVPTIHPASILRGRKAWRKWIVADLEKARRISEREEAKRDV